MLNLRKARTGVPNGTVQIVESITLETDFRFALCDTYPRCLLVDQPCFRFNG